MYLINNNKAVFIAIALSIPLLLIPNTHVFSQYYIPPPQQPPVVVFPWETPSPLDEENGIVELDTHDLSFFQYNTTSLDLEYNREYSVASSSSCSNDIEQESSNNNNNNNNTTEIEEQEKQERLIMTYTDLKNNTVKIYCQYNEWLGNDTRLRQFTAFYNDRILVGLCPYDEAINRHEIYTNSEGEINRVSWISIKSDGSDYVVFNTYLGGYN